jgi:hypothetical protein
MRFHGSINLTALDEYADVFHTGFLKLPVRIVYG